MHSRAVVRGLFGTLVAVIFVASAQSVLLHQAAPETPVQPLEAASAPSPRAMPASTATPPPTSSAPTVAPTVLPTPTPIGGGGILIFDWERERNRDLYAIDLSKGSDPVRLTTDSGVDRSPAWSPDGTYVAFTSRRNRNWDLYLLEVATGEVRRLTQNPHYDGAPAWSPDGQHLAFESMREGDLDVFTLRLADGAISPVTVDPTPDHGPAWSPDGRHIAFIAWRDGNQEIYLASPTGEHTPYNFTENPANDHHPTWLSPDTLSFVSDRDGRSALFVQTTGQAGTIGVASTIQAVAGTRYLDIADHSWSPDRASVASVHTGRHLFGLVISSATTSEQGMFLPVGDGAIGGLDWFSGEALLVAKPDPPPAPPLYIEVVEPGAPPHDLEYLPGVDAPNARLSDRVDDSFNALRQQVRVETGYDFLGILSDAWRPIDSEDEGASYRSWHKAGRAIDTRTELRAPSGRDLLVIVREDVGGRWGRTYWRLYLRTARQDGSMGEPLKQAPWDFFARFVDDEAAVEGGRRQLVPAGYYVDLTALAAGYGWDRIEANDRPGFSWKNDWIASDFWHFENRDQLNWRSAMLEIYDETTVEEHFSSRWDRVR